MSISKKTTGFTLTEAMIGLVLAAFVIGGVISVYVSNQRTATAQTSLSQLQQASQITFQLLSHDLQHAGFSGCANMLSARVVNVLNPVGGGQPWWTQWSGGVRGYEAGNVPAFAPSINALTGTDAVHLMYGRGSSVSVVTHNALANPPLVVNQNNSIIDTNDIVLGCDSKMAVIFQATAIAGNTISHGVGPGTPGNASLSFGFGPNGVAVQQNLAPDGGTLIPLESVAWYVGVDGADSALYRVSLWKNAMQTEKILDDVSNMQIKYLERGGNNYVDATAVVDWETVVAAKVSVTVNSPDDTEISEALRTSSIVVNLRNH